MNEIVKQATQEKAVNENLNFLIDLAMIGILAQDKVTKEEELKHLMRLGVT